MSKNYMTVTGANSLKGELKKLLYDLRPELVRTIQWAASNGDRSENADYIYGKRRLREIDKRIHFITRKLEESEIIDPKEQRQRAGGRVLFGAIVDILDASGVKRIFQIVGQDEVDAKVGKISWASPVGKALLNSKKGDFIEFNTPGGVEEYEILNVSYE